MSPMRIALVAGEHRPFAGGTDLMVLAEAGKLPHQRWASLWRLPELRGIVAADEGVTLGALTTFSEVQRSERLRHEKDAHGRGAAAGVRIGAIKFEDERTSGWGVVGPISRGAPTEMQQVRERAEVPGVPDRDHESLRRRGNGPR